MASTLEPSISWSCQNLCDNRRGAKSFLCVADDDGPTFSGSTGAPFNRSSVSATTMSLASEFDDISNSFTHLSVKEKESAFNDLHGCPDIPKEDPERLAEQLAVLDGELRKKIDTNRSGQPTGAEPSDAYIKAYFQDKAYVEDRKFRLAFLRAERYNVKKTARRIFSFFEQKLNLFGEEKLTEPILYQDLTEDDLYSLHSGALQMLPMKDKAGRTVLITLGSNRREKTTKSYVSLSND